MKASELIQKLKEAQLELGDPKVLIQSGMRMEKNDIRSVEWIGYDTVLLTY